MDRIRSGETIDGVGQNWDVEIRLGADDRREIWGKMRIIAAPVSVLALLTDAQHMMNWLARSVTADARPGGVFCLADMNGLRVEGTILRLLGTKKSCSRGAGSRGSDPDSQQ
jgi:hypothetical protein